MGGGVPGEGWGLATVRERWGGGVNDIQVGGELDQRGKIGREEEGQYGGWSQP